MPPKITSKNLSYDTSVPPFLAALRAQASGSSGPDPILTAQRRGVKKRSDSEEAEDVPLVVDEEGNVVKDLEVDKDGVVLKDFLDHGQESKDKSVKDPEAGGTKTSFGGRKRKVGKVIGDTADQAEDKASGNQQEQTIEAKDKSKERKPKKKPKKIKLSFDEDEG
ncbi:hypothetical protein BGZ63DRAFT_62307 [Mariannaea sp. PMI_226]|nr:hypothetical protein BGZ63DRAFT_62307 [Mariannaea sp. PMI_226]